MNDVTADKTVPLEIRRVAGEDAGLLIIWSDGLEQRISNHVLRSHCPCAKCEEERGSSTHASRANQRWFAWQWWQCASAKNTGVQANCSRSISMPVEMARPVVGQLIMIVPIRVLPACRPSDLAPWVCVQCESRLSSL